MINVIQTNELGETYDDNSLLPAHKKRILSLPNDENKPYAMDINVVTENTNIINNINSNTNSEISQIKSSFCIDTAPTDTTNI